MMSREEGAKHTKAWKCLCGNECRKRRGPEGRSRNQPVVIQEVQDWLRSRESIKLKFRVKNKNKVREALIDSIRISRKGNPTNAHACLIQC